MFKNLSKLIFIVIVLIAISGCSVSNNNEHDGGNNEASEIELTISAAVSLQESLEEIKKTYEQANESVTIKFNYGSSGSLQQQISQGAPVDIFMSAAEDKFSKLIEQNLIDDGDSHNLLKNELVLIVSKESDHNISEFAHLAKQNVNSISIGIPETVPAGKYAKESLESLNIWSDVEEKIVFAKDVRQVLSYVETGNVQAGIVYKTDALTSSKVEIVASAVASSHAPIIYPVGVVNESRNYNAAKDFYLYLQQEKTLKVFEKHGFIVK